MALVLGFQSSSNLAAAYGIAVTGTMMIDTILVAFVMTLLWRWHWMVVALLAGGLLLVDFAFFAANAIKDSPGRLVPAAHRVRLVHGFDDLEAGPRTRPQRANPSVGPVEHRLEADGPRYRAGQGLRRLPDLGGGGRSLGAAAQPEAQPDAARDRTAYHRADARRPLCRRRKAHRAHRPQWRLLPAAGELRLHADARHARGAGRVQAAWLDAST